MPVDDVIWITEGWLANPLCVVAACVLVLLDYGTAVLLAPVRLLYSSS